MNCLKLRNVWFPKDLFKLANLIDFINFGVAPAITVYIWILKDLGNVGWLLVLFHSVACCLRLARFNLTKIDSKQP